jgi:hypothetical protein
MKLSGTEDRAGPNGLKKAAASLAPPLFLIFTIFVFGPYTLYQGNIDEFTVSLPAMLRFFLGPGLILFALLSLIGLLLPRRAHQLYVSVLLALGLLIWLQGNFLVWKYGLLNGRGFDWSRNAWRGWIDGTLWVGLLALAFLFYRRIYKIAVPASLILTAALGASLLFTSLQKPETWATAEKSSLPTIPPEEIFEFSSGQNVIQFILDGFQSDIFEEIVAEQPDFYSKSLEGFTFFKEATGSFRSTYMAVPAFLSGSVYKNDIPMRKFLNGANRGRTIFNVLYHRGFETDLVCDWRFARGATYSHHYPIAVPYGGTKQQNVKSASALMLDLVLFRHAPHFLKKFIASDDLWLIQRFLTPADDSLNLRYFSHQAFLRDMIEHLSVTRTKPVYKYVHLMTTHFPIVVNKDCQQARDIPATRENIRAQARCGLNEVLKFLDELRSKGIYDSSLIILQADHGIGQNIKMANLDKSGSEVDFIKERTLPQIAGFALPLLAIKPPHSAGGLKISRAQVELTDIPATVGRLLGLDAEFGGRPVFEVDPNEVRERRFYFHEWQDKNWQSDYLSRLDEFVIDGSAFDRNSWRWNETYYPRGRTGKK